MGHALVFALLLCAALLTGARTDVTAPVQKPSWDFGSCFTMSGYIDITHNSNSPGTAIPTEELGASLFTSCNSTDAGVPYLEIQWNNSLSMTMFFKIKQSPGQTFQLFQIYYIDEAKREWYKSISGFNGVANGVLKCRHSNTFQLTLKPSNNTPTTEPVSSTQPSSEATTEATPRFKQSGHVRFDVDRVAEPRESDSVQQEVYVVLSDFEIHYFDGPSSKDSIKSVSYCRLEPDLMWTLVGSALGAMAVLVAIGSAALKFS